MCFLRMVQDIYSIFMEGVSSIDTASFPTSESLQDRRLCAFYLLSINSFKNENKRVSSEGITTYSCYNVIARTAADVPYQ